MKCQQGCSTTSTRCHC